MVKLFDSKCLDLAQYFYPDYPEPIQKLLAEEIQTTCEDFTGGLKHDLEEIIAERRAAPETSPGHSDNCTVWDGTHKTVCSCGAVLNRRAE
jgi:hypothetical protein